VVKVLWVSRHKPLKVQLEELKRIFGDYSLKQYSGIVPNAGWLMNYVKTHGYDVVIPVLPLTVVARFTELAENVLVLWAEMTVSKQMYRKPEAFFDYDPDRETVVASVDEKGRMLWKVMRFKKFYRLLGVKLELEPIESSNLYIGGNLRIGEVKEE